MQATKNRIKKDESSSLELPFLSGAPPQQICACADLDLKESLSSSLSSCLRCFLYVTMKLCSRLPVRFVARSHFALFYFFNAGSILALFTFVSDKGRRNIKSGHQAWGISTANDSPDHSHENLAVASKMIQEDVIEWRGQPMMKFIYLEGCAHQHNSAHTNYCLRKIKSEN